VSVVAHAQKTYIHTRIAAFTNPLHPPRIRHASSVCRDISQGNLYAKATALPSSPSQRCTWWWWAAAASSHMGGGNENGQGRNGAEVRTHWILSPAEAREYPIRLRLGYAEPGRSVFTQASDSPVQTDKPYLLR
jgi:hypothetical protein